MKIFLQLFVGAALLLSTATVAYASDRGERRWGPSHNHHNHRDSGAIIYYGNSYPRHDYNGYPYFVDPRFGQRYYGYPYFRDPSFGIYYNYRDYSDRRHHRHYDRRNDRHRGHDGHRHHDRHRGHDRHHDHGTRSW